MRAESVMTSPEILNSIYENRFEKVVDMRHNVPILTPMPATPARRNQEINMQTVLLTSGTVGTTQGSADIGDTVTIELHDENGMPIRETGEVAEILE
jgi:hypothetical protein